jgi:putative membrane protein
MLSIIQPLISLILTQNFWGIWSSSFLLAVVASTGVLLTANQIFLYLVNRNGELNVGVGSISLLKGFLANWLEGLTYPLEDYFERLGIATTVYVKLFAFKVKQQLRGILVIPQVHPGPFKNLGSSNLPYRIQKSLEKQNNLIAAVPHGASGHELDLTSQIQCEKVIDEMLKKATFSDFSKEATRLIRVKVDSAQTTCQFFGKTGLLTSTYSPKGMEDIPFDLGMEIMRQGESLGAKGVAFIDAHNSATQEGETPSFSEGDEVSLKTSTYKALEHSLKEKQDPFRMGIAKVIPEDFTLSQGLGPGGIVALVFIVDDQKAAYVTIDGNNMVNGLREEIINSLSDLVDDCEILTTDTHMVNAIITSGRGYHPIGEAMDNSKLFKHIRNSVMEALRGADWAETSYKSIVIRDVKVFGEEKILNLMVFLDKISNYSKLIASVIYLPAILIAITPFLLI